MGESSFRLNGLRLGRPNGLRRGDQTPGRPRALDRRIVLSGRTLALTGGILLLLAFSLARLHLFPGAVAAFVAKANSFFQGSGPSRITVWAWEPAAAALRALGAEYSASHPSVVIEIETREKGDFAHRLRTAYGGGQAPDMALADPDWAFQLFKEGFFWGLIPDTAWRERLFPAALESYRWKEHLYAIPLDVEPWVFFYRRDRMEEILGSAGLKGYPSSWTSFLKFAAGVASAGRGEILVLGEGGALEFIQVWLPASKGLLADDQGRTGLAEPEALEAVKLMVSLYGNKGSSGAGSIVPGDARWREMLAAGKVIGLLARPSTGYWFIERQAPDQRGKWSAGPVPARVPEGFNSIAGGIGLGITSQTLHPEEALGFLRFVSYQEESQQAYFRATGRLPANTAAVKPRVLAGAGPWGSSYFGPFWEGVAKAALNSSPAPPLERPRQVLDLLDLEFRKVIEGNETPAEMMPSLAEKVAGLLKD